MKYDEENWIKVYTRDTAGWLAVSWQARGLGLEIARKLPKTTGELSLGRRGLEALAALLRAPWAEIAPFVQELIDDGRLVYDPEQQTICDPQHPSRQEAVASGKVRTAEWREREKSKSSKPANDVTSGDARVTRRDAPVTPSDQEKEKKEEKEIPPTPQGEPPPSRAVDIGTTLALEVCSRYEVAVSQATGSPFALPPRAGARHDLIKAVNAHCPERTAPTILAWVDSRVTAWVVPRREEPHFAGNFEPRHFLGWLNAGSRSPPAETRRTGTDDGASPRARRSLDGYKP